jgi:hypothetical protein
VGTIKMNNLKAFAIKQNAEAVGLGIHDLGCSRREAVNVLQLRAEEYVAHGGNYLDAKGNPIEIHEDFIEDALGDDPGYKWFSAFPKACNQGLKRAPSKKIQRRLQVLDLALRTPPLGLAV